jgi:hypothetical protein
VIDWVQTQYRMTLEPVAKDERPDVNDFLIRARQAMSDAAHASAPSPGALARGHSAG